MKLCRKCGADSDSPNCCNNGALASVDVENDPTGVEAPIKRRKRRTKAEIEEHKATEVE